VTAEMMIDCVGPRERAPPQLSRFWMEAALAAVTSSAAIKFGRESMMIDEKLIWISFVNPWQCSASHTEYLCSS
jgi:hypothetical protein